MKDTFLTILRQSSTPPALFRKTAHQLSLLLAAEAMSHLPIKKVHVETPIGSTVGTAFQPRVVLTTILRAGLAMLPAFEHFFPSAPIGFFGMRRDEKTAIPKPYYQNLPQITSEDWIFLIDPMLATGGSSSLALAKLEEAGANLRQTILVSIIASEAGVELIHQKFPSVRLIFAAADPALNQQKFIVPGLGDFGDRFFGT